jgi:D-alanyl-D-alanine carboxypeptidase/Putative peptidoglycan binding domain
MAGEDWFAPTDDDVGDDGGVWAPDAVTDDDGFDAADDPASTPVVEAPASPSRGTSTLPVHPAKIPGWVKKFENGHLAQDSMIKVAPISEGYLIPEAAAGWRTLQLAAQQAGFNLTMSGGYRSYERQVAMFHERFTTSENGGPTKQWNGTTYWQRPKVAMAATPGRSNHGWGAAVDMALGGYAKAAQDVRSSSAFLDWIVPRAKDYGWSWEVQSEPWHVRLVGDGTRPAAVGGQSQQSGLSSVPNSNANSDKAAYPVPKPSLRLGAAGGQVAALQNLLIWFGWADFTRADGKFGAQTEAAVKKMQTQFGVESIGIYGDKSAAALANFLVGK